MREGEEVSNEITYLIFIILFKLTCLLILTIIWIERDKFKEYFLTEDKED